MSAFEKVENEIKFDDNVFLYYFDFLENEEHKNNEISKEERLYFETELEFLKNNFAGHIISLSESQTFSFEGKEIYICGNISTIIKKCDFKNQNVYMIDELSYNYDVDQIHKYDIHIISSCILPLHVHHVGILFKQYFPKEDFFGKISREHQFQPLTESSKQSKAYRKGIYLSKVSQDSKMKTVLRYSLLRCSTNFDWPTENFGTTDMNILEHVNRTTNHFLREKVCLNHVLAQIYQNKLITNEFGYSVERKGSIRSHSDKTKDMPKTGVIAFCTFYEDDAKSFENKGTYIHKSKSGHGKSSVLTSLVFQLKKEAYDIINPHTGEPYTRKFSVLLYPNSLFIIPLSTNRLYTHEIKPPLLPIGKFPVRMGYVIRCSETKAEYDESTGETTVVCVDGSRKKLERPTEADAVELKSLYYKENTTTDMVFYDDVLEKETSLNDGDYMKPMIMPSGESSERK